ncbi:MAG: hypothetical protein ABEK17_02635 [Candidatus Aenigmatarchaeota archaeon]
MKKGLEVGIERIIYVIAAIVFILIIISITRNLLSEAELENEEITISGDKQRVVDKLSDIIEHCWDNYEESYEGRICYRVNVNFDGNITELDVTRKLNCESLPNNKCLIGNCSFCDSFKYEEDDKIDWRDESIEGEGTVIVKFIPQKIVVEKQTKVIS